jgi:hypothetical protein
MVKIYWLCNVDQRQSVLLHKGRKGVRELTGRTKDVKGVMSAEQFRHTEIEGKNIYRFVEGFHLFQPQKLKAAKNMYEIS